MNLFKVAGIFFASLSIALCQSETVTYKFDCHKFVSICKNDASCSTEPNCVCAGDFNGYDCSNEAVSTACTDDGPCKNGGTCYQTGADPPTRCFCPFGYYGTDCAIKLVDITCQGESASYTITFPSEFSGRVTLLDSNLTSLNDVCPFDEKEENGRKSYTLTVDITDDDSTQALTCKKSNLKIFDENKRTFQAKIKVFYTQLLDTKLDEFLTLNCTHNTEDGEVSIDFKDVDFNQDDLENTEEASEYQAFELEITDDEDKSIENDQSISVGQKLSLDLYPREKSGYTKVLFTSCVANNTLTGTDARSLTILNKGCPTLQAMVVSATQTATSKLVDLSSGTSVTKTGVSVSFSVFKFSGNSSQIGITCLARACKDGDANCDIPTNCSDILKEETTDNVNDNTVNGETNQGRRKRAADDDDNQQTISKVFKVVGSKQEKENTSTENETEESVDPVEECLARTEITAVVAVLSAAVCVLLTVCFILACVILRRKGKNISSFERPVLQPTPDRFQIPRAHVNESYEIM